MFRISRFLHEMLHPPREPAPAARRAPPGPVVIWNLIRRCNLTCKHCYAFSADTDFPGELSTAEALTVLDDLRAFRVPAVILSGGEPLLRDDLPIIAARAKELGFYTALSTNGTLIDEARMREVAAMGFDYVGISLDGRRETHDRFRRRVGAFDASLAAVRRCRDAGIKVGLRFTLTRDNAEDLPWLLDLMEKESVEKFYLSHLNYAGRGNAHRGRDAFLEVTRQAMEWLFERALEAERCGLDREFVTGNNDADGPFLLQWSASRFPGAQAALRASLERWGGNSTGVNVANIDNLGNVHPDTYWWDYSLGNVRERPFSAIWRDPRDPIMAGLRATPRPVGGRCARCAHLAICGGNTRVRARALTGDPWAEDPGCYLSDVEIGLPAGTDARHETSRAVRTIPIREVVS